MLKRNLAINCGDKGVALDCPKWSDKPFHLRLLIGISYDSMDFRCSRKFSGQNPTWKCGPASVGDHFEELFRMISAGFIVNVWMNRGIFTPTEKERIL